MIALRQPTREECQQVRVWRNDPAVLPMLRTGPKTEAEQDAFFRDVVSEPGSDHRYFALLCAGVFVGLGGLTYLARVPSEAEISLIIGPELRKQGLGVHAVRALLDEAARIDLHVVIGECYSGGHLAFWKRMYGHQWPGWRPAICCDQSDGSFTWRWERTR